MIFDSGKTTATEPKTIRCHYTSSRVLLTFMWLLELNICTPIIFLCLWGSLHWPSTGRAGVKLGASNSGLGIVRTKPEYTSLIETCLSNQTPPPHHVLTTKRYYLASTTINRLEIEIIFWNSFLFTSTRLCRINSHSKSTVNAPTLIIFIFCS